MSKKFKGTELAKLVDVAEEIKQKSEQKKEAVFDSNDLEYQLTSMGYEPDVAKDAVVNYDPKQCSIKPVFTDISSIVDASTKKNTELTNKKNIENSDISTTTSNNTSLIIGSVTTGTGAGLTSAYLAFETLYPTDPSLAIVSGTFSFILGMFGGIFAGAKLGTKFTDFLYDISGIKKSFEQNKKDKLSCVKEKIERLEEKLSHLDDNYVPGDFILFNSVVTGYSMALATGLEEDKVVMVKQYKKLISDCESNQIIQTYKCPKSKIINSFELQSQIPLTEKELFKTPIGTPMLCAKNEKLLGFGIFGQVDTKKFTLYTDTKYKYESNEYAVSQVRDKQIDAYVLCPRIKK